MATRKARHDFGSEGRTAADGVVDAAVIDSGEEGLERFGGKNARIVFAFGTVQGEKSAGLDVLADLVGAGAQAGRGERFIRTRRIEGTGSGES